MLMSTVSTEFFSPKERLESDGDGIIRQFVKGIPWCTSCVEKLLHPSALVVPGDNRPDAWRQSVKTRVTSFLSSPQRYEVLSRTVSPISHYITTNNGWSTTGDPYKLAYWYGVELAKELRAVSPFDGMVAMIATVETLNNFLHASNGKRPVMHSQMMDKIHRSIVRGSWESEFGAHGLYFAFKALAKSPLATSTTNQS